MNQTVPRPLVRLNQIVIVLSVILSIITQNFYILLLPISANLSGVVLGKNYLMVIGKQFLKKKPSEYIQEHKDDLRFNSTLAVSMLVVSLVGYIVGNQVIAIVFALMVLTAASIALMGFCVGCFLRFQITKRYYTYKRKRA